MRVLVLLLFITSSVLSQNVTTLNKRFFNYKLSGSNEIKLYNRTEYDIDSEIVSDYIYDNNYTLVYTDICISEFVSDSINLLFKKRYNHSEKQIRKLTEKSLIELTGDTIPNILYTEVRSSCNDCQNSIINLIYTDNEITKDISRKKFKHVTIFYYQVTTEKSYDVILIYYYTRFRLNMRQLYLYERQKKP